MHTWQNYTTAFGIVLLLLFPTFLVFMQLGIIKALPLSGFPIGIIAAQIIWGHE